MLKLFIQKNKLLITLILIFIIGEIIINPIANFPLNDDWTYGKSVKTFLNSGKIDIGDFAAMTLFSHLMWGALFTKIFGFSFTVLRFSTFVSAIISAIVLNKITVNITNNRVAGFIVCMVLLFNPIYFSLSNTFMTDVNFNTLLILSCYFAFEFFKKQKLFPFIMVFIVSAVIVLIRQYGIIIPLCFTFACLFLNNKKGLYVGLSVVGAIAVVVIFKYYENYLKGILPPGSAYKFSGDNHITSALFWNKFFTNLKARYTLTLLHVLIFAFPFAVTFVISLFRDFKLYTEVIVSVLSAGLSYFLFREVSFPLGNILTNTALGAETFVQTLIPQFHTEMHTYSEGMQQAAVIIKYVFSSVTLTCFVLISLKLIRKKRNPLKADARIVYLISLFFSYNFMILITDSYFDRYYIPLISITLILLTFVNINYTINYKLAILPLLLFLYISVFGTKDYFELNRKRWEAYYFLKEKVGIDHSKINGGFEVTCWYEGKPTGSYYYMDLYIYDYLIQYNQEQGFRKIKEYEFQRYFPYKKDKIYIFINEQKK